MINFSKQFAVSKAGVVSVFLTLQAESAALLASCTGIAAVLKSRLSDRDRDAKQPSDKACRKTF